MDMREIITEVLDLFPELYKSVDLDMEVVGAMLISTKRRDMREPGRLKKIKIERMIQAVFTRRFKRQMETLKQRGVSKAKPKVKVPIDLPEWEEEEFVKEIIDILYSASKYGVELFSDQVSIGIDYTLSNANALKFAREYTYELVKGIDTTTRDIISNAVSDFVDTPGFSIGDVIDQLETVFSEKRASSIAVTETTRAFAEGQKLAGEELRREFPDVKVYKTWFTNNDDRVCDICGPLDGQSVDIDDAFPGGDPPAHVNCILPGNNVIPIGKISAAAKSFYNGRCVEICLSDGSNITVTSKHKILTTRGWVAADQITKFDNLISTSDNVKQILGTVNPNNYDIPARIEEIFSSLKMSSVMPSRRVPTSTVDFNGDGRFINGNIEIINVDSFLNSNVYSNIHKPFSNSILNRVALCLALASSGVYKFILDRLLFSANRIMGVIKHFSLLLTGGVFPANIHGIRYVARSNASRNYSLSESPSVNTRLARKFLLRFPGKVSVKQVSKIRYFDFSGHVYDLQCDEYELYICNTIIAHNCRCWTQYNTKI